MHGRLPHWSVLGIGALGYRNHDCDQRTRCASQNSWGMTRGSTIRPSKMTSVTSEGQPQHHLQYKSPEPLFFFSSHSSQDTKKTHSHILRNAFIQSLPEIKATISSDTLPPTHSCLYTMSFLYRSNAVLRSAAIRPSPRLFSTAVVYQKSATETVKDGLKAVDRTMSDAAVKGIDAGGKLYLSDARADSSSTARYLFEPHNI